MRAVSGGFRLSHASISLTIPPPPAKPNPTQSTGPCSRAQADRVFRDAFGDADILRKFEEMARRMQQQPGASSRGFPGGPLGGIGPEELDALLRGVFGRGGFPGGANPFGGGGGGGGGSAGGYTTTSQEMYSRPDGVRVVRTTTVVHHPGGRAETRCAEASGAREYADEPVGDTRPLAIPVGVSC